MQILFSLELQPLALGIVLKSWLLETKKRKFRKDVPIGTRTGLRSVEYQSIIQIREQTELCKYGWRIKVRSPKQITYKFWIHTSLRNLDDGAPSPIDASFTMMRCIRGLIAPLDRPTGHVRVGTTLWFTVGVQFEACLGLQPFCMWVCIQNKWQDHGRSKESIKGPSWMYNSSTSGLTHYKMGLINWAEKDSKSMPTRGFISRVIVDFLALFSDKYVQNSYHPLGLIDIIIAFGRIRNAI